MKPSALCSESVISVMALTMLSFWASSAFFLPLFLHFCREGRGTGEGVASDHTQTAAVVAGLSADFKPDCPFFGERLDFLVNTTVPE